MEQETNKLELPPVIHLALFLVRVTAILFIFNLASCFIIVNKSVFAWYFVFVCITMVMMPMCMFLSHILIKPYRIGPKDNKGDNDDS